MNVSIVDCYMIPDIMQAANNGSYLLLITNSKVWSWPGHSLWVIDLECPREDSSSSAYTRYLLGLLADKAMIILNEWMQRPRLNYGADTLMYSSPWWKIILILAEIQLVSKIKQRLNILVFQRLKYFANESPMMVFIIENLFYSSQSAIFRALK